MMDVTVTAPETPSAAAPRGRPVDRSNKGLLQRLEIWLHVETVRARYIAKFGKAISIVALTGWIERHGGIGSAIGGDVDAIEKAMERERGRKQLKATRRARKRRADGTVTIVDCPVGKVFVKDVFRAKQSIRARYYEAKRVLASDPRLRFHYENLLAERLGRPLPHARSAITTPVRGR